MSDEAQPLENKGNAASHDREAALTRRSPGPSEAQSPPVTYRVNPQGEWIPERAEADRKDRQAAHKQELEAADAQHRREQDAKDSELRRRAMHALGTLILTALVVATLIAVNSDNAETRVWAQNLVVVLLSGVVGASAGWFAKGAGK